MAWIRKIEDSLINDFVLNGNPIDKKDVEIIEEVNDEEIDILDEEENQPEKNKEEKRKILQEREDARNELRGVRLSDDPLKDHQFNHHQLSMFRSNPMPNFFYAGKEDLRDHIEVKKIPEYQQFIEEFEGQQLLFSDRFSRPDPAEENHMFETIFLVLSNYICIINPKFDPSDTFSIHEISLIEKISSPSQIDMQIDFFFSKEYFERIKTSYKTELITIMQSMFYPKARRHILI